MKKKIFTLVTASFITVVTVMGQTNYEWENSINSQTINVNIPPSTVVTADIPITGTSTMGRVGIGIQTPTIPGAKLDVKFCPVEDIPGIMVTRKHCGNYAIPYNYFDLPVSYDAVDIPDLEPPANWTATLPSFQLFGYGSSGTSFGAHPLIWAKTQNDPSIPGTSGGATTQFIVTPFGRTGVNIENPRATFDIKTLGGYNFPALIIGKQRSSTKTQHVHFVPMLSSGGYNNITQTGDMGLFFTDGGGTLGENQNGAFVIAPWAQSSISAGGLRMDNMGNVELRGDLRATKVEVDAKWWPDFVFDKSYKLSPLSEVKTFIDQNGHLPGMPSESTIMSTGQNIGELQKIQQQKIEELTLYTIQQEEQIRALEEKLSKLTELVEKMKND